MYLERKTHLPLTHTDTHMQQNQDSWYWHPNPEFKARATSEFPPSEEDLGFFLWSVSFEGQGKGAMLTQEIANL